MLPKHPWTMSMRITYYVVPSATQPWTIVRSTPQACFAKNQLEAAADINRPVRRTQYLQITLQNRLP